MPLYVLSTPTGPRVYARVRGREYHLHHGLDGAVLALASTAALTVCAPHHQAAALASLGLGLALCAHDRRDFPWSPRS